MSNDQKIFVTKTFLPPLAEYQAYLERIWSANHLTNQGPLLQKFEAKVRERLKLSHFHFVTNGTVALQIALRALDITEGEVITTPFSYVATVSAILWERCRPVFVDIESETFCIDPNRIEAAITDRTRAIMAVHVFGNPCDVEAIEAIAKRHNLKVIYDAAHAFGVSYRSRSLLTYGDISTCSFHATKLFHTIEGGGLVTDNGELSDKIELIKRFGHNADEHLQLGINGKASEFQAAMGLCNLQYLNTILAERRKITQTYNTLLQNRFERPTLRPETTYNYAYYPILFPTEAELLSTVSRLNAANIYPRRYFYPSLNTLPYLAERQSTPISEEISVRVLCLPIFVGLDKAAIDRICSLVRG